MRYIDNSTHGKENLSKKHFTDAGLDICSNEDKIIPSRNSSLIDTGIHIEIPEGFVGMIKSRSGLSVKHKIEIGAGIIDHEFRGIVMVHLYNHGDKPFEIKKGDRIAQLLTIPILLDKYTKVNVLTETERGESGFGSSGV